MVSHSLSCSDCGRFMRTGTWANIYDFVGMGLDREHFRCGSCTEKRGPATSNARPYDGDMSPYQGWLTGEKSQ